MRLRGRWLRALHAAAAARADRQCWFYDLRSAPIDYRVAHAWQLQLRRERAGAARQAVASTPALPDVFILLTHRPVYTLGTRATEAHLKFDTAQPPCQWVRTERGGHVTYHGPGQLVGYPVLDLRRHRCDLRWYVRTLEEVLLQTLAHFGVRASRMPAHSGVWVDGAYKVAAIGVSATRWITCHGFALNVERQSVPPFARVVPCGLDSLRIGCLHDFVPRPEDAPPDAVRQVLAERFADLFQLQLVSYRQQPTLEGEQAEVAVRTASGTAV